MCFIIQHTFDSEWAKQSIRPSNHQPVGLPSIQPSSHPSINNENNIVWEWKTVWNHFHDKKCLICYKAEFLLMLDNWHLFQWMILLMILFSPDFRLPRSIRFSWTRTNFGMQICVGCYGKSVFRSLHFAGWHPICG